MADEPKKIIEQTVYVATQVDQKNFISPVISLVEKLPGDSH